MEGEIAAAEGEAKAGRKRTADHGRWSSLRKRMRVEEYVEGVEEPLEEAVGERETLAGETKAEDAMEIGVASDKGACEEDGAETALSDERERIKRKVGPAPEESLDEPCAEEDFGDEEADGFPEDASADDDSFATVGPDLTEDWESFKALNLEDLTAYGIAHGEVKTGRKDLVPCGVVSTNGSVQWV